MGMYVCDPCFQKYGLTDAPSGTGHAQCEICGPLRGDWETKFDVHFTYDIQRPVLVADPKQFVLDQLDEVARQLTEKRD